MDIIRFVENNGYVEFSYGEVYGLIYFDGKEASIESPADPFYVVPTKAMNLEELEEDGAAYREILACIMKYIAMDGMKKSY